MKSANNSAIVFLALFVLSVQGQDSTITKVVTLLQQMLEKSQKEGYEEEHVWTKFKCFCDQNEAEKTTSVKDATKAIAFLESEIETMTGAIGFNQMGVNQIRAQHTANQQEIDELDHLLEDVYDTFTKNNKTQTDLINQVGNAIQTLADIGADQSSAKGDREGNKRFMAGFKGASLVSIHKEVSKALRAASALMTEKQRGVVNSFIQAPFTGTYTSQSAEIIGILKQMRKTFQVDQADMEATFHRQSEEYENMIGVIREANRLLMTASTAKDGVAGVNEQRRSERKLKLAAEKKELVNSEAFLKSLLPTCDKKAKSYEARKLIRANEEAAISQAISILSSDASFETFGQTKATRTENTLGLKSLDKLDDELDAMFLQTRELREVHAHVPVDPQAHPDVKEMTKVLQNAAVSATSKRLPRVLAALQTGNAFDEVMDLMVDILDDIDEEQLSDKKKLDLCNSDIASYAKDVDKKEAALVQLNDNLDKKKDDIHSAVDGDLALIKKAENNMQAIKTSQASLTNIRTEENVAYQKNIKGTVDAELILTKAVKVLTAFYEDLELKIKRGEAGFLQKTRRGRQPDATIKPDASSKPDYDATWEGSYEGQKGSGGDAITMLKFILKETQKEQKSLHTNEEAAQATYEDAMQTSKDKEAKVEQTLSDLQLQLARNEESYLSFQQSEKADSQALDATYDLANKTEADCKFILTHYKTRKANRETEAHALKVCMKKIKLTPAYKTAEREAEVKSMGECSDQCTDDDKHVDCLACMGDVTVVAYCTGHHKQGKDKEPVKGCEEVFKKIKGS